MGLQSADGITHWILQRHMFRHLVSETVEENKDEKAKIELLARLQIVMGSWRLPSHALQAALALAPGSTRSHTTNSMPTGDTGREKTIIKACMQPCTRLINTQPSLRFLVFQHGTYLDS